LTNSKGSLVYFKALADILLFYNIMLSIIPNDIISGQLK